MTFLAPLFLLGLAVGLLPVLLHMIHRQKAKEVQFSTLRFLRLSVQRTRRRKFIDDFALLLVRMGVLLLLALGLANPIVTTLASLWGQGRARAVAIIFDNSASMGTMDGGQPRVETARKAAAQVIDGLREEDTIAFFATSGPQPPEQGKLYHTHETVRQALAQCRVSYERADLAGKLQQAKAVLAKSDITNREIYIITDNQALSWETLKENPEPAKDADIPVVLVQVHKDPVPNVAIRGVSLETPAPAVGVPITAVVEVANPGNLPHSRNVELFLDGRKEAVSPTLNMAAGTTARHEFRFTLDRPGIHRGEVRLAEDDGNPLDNRRYFVVAVDQQVAVAIVIPQRHAITLADDAFYLERVLAPTGGAGWSIRPKTITLANLAEERLGSYAAIFCVNLPALEPALGDKFRDYIETGGHLFWFAGDNVQPDAYNRMNDQAGGKLLPAILGPLRQADKDSWRIASLDKDHAVMRALLEPVSLYQSVLVHKHFPLSNLPGSPPRVLAQLEGGQALLVERRLGAGSVLLMGTAAHVEWTNLPVRPIFLPLMARMTFRLAGIEAERAQVLAGAPLLIPLPASPPKGEGVSIEIEVIQPSGDIFRVPVVNAKERVFRYGDTHEVGTYLFRLLNVQETRPFAFAVNADPDECETAVMAQEELARRLGKDRVVFCENPDDVAGVIHRLREGQSLWETLLFAVLGCLLLEAYLANCRARKPPTEQVPKAT